jgi:hypothetical protein
MREPSSASRPSTVVCPLAAGYQFGEPEEDKRVARLRFVISSSNFGTVGELGAS